MSINYFYNLAKNRLYPLNRSLTGKGTKSTLKIIKKEFPELKIRKIKSGTKVFDWKIPDEWDVTDAFVRDEFGKKIVDFKKHNLHLIGYSSPVDRYFYKKELFKNLFSLKNLPNAIPYITSYYKKRWGFCVTHEEKLKFLKKYKNNNKFKVLIKSKFKKGGFLNYGELLIKGQTKEEILKSTYICHPSMANNELSGPIVSMSLIKYFKKYGKLKRSLRFIFIPETIGSIAYIKLNFDKLRKRVIGGFNLSCIGDERQHSCMFSKHEDSASDESIIEAYKKLKIKNYKIYSFLERGSDERQFNSPGIDLKISSIFRTKYGEYPEYHTSLDNFQLVTQKGVREGFNVAKHAINILQNKIIPKTKILCEPQLEKGAYIQQYQMKKKNFKKFFRFFTVLRWK